MDHPSNLFLAADDGVDFALFGQRGEIPRVLLQRAVAALGVLVGDAVVAADTLQGGVDLLGIRPGGAQDELGVTLLLGGDGDQQVLGAEELVAQALGLVLRRLEHRGGARGDHDLGHRTRGRLGQLLQRDHQVLLYLFGVDAQLA